MGMVAGPRGQRVPERSLRWTKDQENEGGKQLLEGSGGADNLIEKEQYSFHYQGPGAQDGKGKLEFELENGAGKRKTTQGQSEGRKKKKTMVSRSELWTGHW